MKTKKNALLIMLISAFLISINLFAQEAENQPVYLTVTTGHWSSDPDVDYTDWLKNRKRIFR